MQGLVEFLVLGGLAAGSLGLFIYPWMAPAAPWGFAMPVVFALGYVFLERRRQRDLVAERARIAENEPAAEEAALNTFRRNVLEGRVDEFRPDQWTEAERFFRAGAAQRQVERLERASDTIAPRHDWGVLLWSLACAVAGGAAFFIAWQARPAEAPAPHDWQPPRGAVTVDLSSQ